MKLKCLILSFLVAFVAQAQIPGGVVTSPEAAFSNGTGPYPASFFADPTLNNHTIYQPRVIPTGLKVPALVWSNGGCLSSDTIMFPFLVQIASQDSGKGNYTHMDASRIGVAGQSCGGLEAYTAVNDSRVSVIGIFNSGGNITGSPTTNPATITKPVFYVLGGPTDIAYTAEESDYNNLPATTPAWKGNLPVGHGGTYNEVNGGEIGVAASYMYEWMLRGDSNSSSWFTVDTAASAAGWEVVSKNLDKISVAPI